jgi:glutaredoxin
MSGKRINRITLFKIPKKEDRQKLLGIYKEMPQKAVKVSEHTHTHTHTYKKKKKKRKKRATSSQVPFIFIFQC